MSAPSESPGQGSETPQAKEIVPQIAAAWGTSRAYVYKLKRQGCPVHDVALASKWREEHASRGIGFRSKAKPEAGNPPAGEIGNPISGVHGDTHGPRGRKCGAADPYGKDAGTSGTAERRALGARPEERVLASLYDSVEAAIAIETEAFRLVQEAQRQRKDTIIAIRIAAYTKAQTGRFDAEERYRKEMERQKILVPLEEAKRLGRRGYDIMVPLLRALSKNAAPQCNPSDPLMASKILTAEIERIIAAACGAFADGEPGPDVPAPMAAEPEEILNPSNSRELNDGTGEEAGDGTAE